VLGSRASALRDIATWRVRFSLESMAAYGSDRDRDHMFEREYIG